MTVIIELLQTMLFAAVPAVGFALLFNVPRSALIHCAIGGAIGRGLRFLLITAGLPLVPATFVAATVVSLLGVYIAQRMRAHPKVITVASIIPMIPGVPFFTALLAVAQIQRDGLTQQLLTTAITSALNALWIVGALAVGLALPGLLIYRRKPVV